MIRIYVNGGSLCAGGDVGTGRRGNPVLDVGTRSRIGVEWFDVEDNGNDIHVQPESGTQIGRLIFYRVKKNRSSCGTSRTSLRSETVTPAPKNLQRCSMENLRSV